MASPAQAGLFKKLGAVGVAVAGVETAAIASATVDAIGDTSLCRAASDQTWVRGGLRLRPKVPTERIVNQPECKTILLSAGDVVFPKMEIPSSIFGNTMVVSFHAGDRHGHC